VVVTVVVVTVVVVTVVVVTVVVVTVVVVTVVIVVVLLVVTAEVVDVVVGPSCTEKPVKECGATTSELPWKLLTPGSDSKLERKSASSGDALSLSAAAALTNSSALRVVDEEVNS
jgi:hypothetical protein